jgi:hypothetical protein
MYASLSALQVFTSTLFGRWALEVDSGVTPLVVIVTAIIGFMLGGFFIFNLVLVCNNWTTLEAASLHQNQTYQGLSAFECF